MEKQLKIDDLRLHYREGNMSDTYQKILDSFTSTSKYEEKNSTGYSGVHYIIIPNFTDGFYENTNPQIYPFAKLELQVRTIMQHAWSEAQHKIVYKGDRSEESDKMETRFSDLSAHIDACDKAIDSLIQISPPYRPAKSFEPRDDKESQPNEKEKKFINDVNDLVVNKLDKVTTSQSEAIILRTSFVDDHKEEVQLQHFHFKSVTKLY